METSVNPIVSICITTYNHEKYIQQAIESIFEQNIDFPIEVIISNDNSTDKTSEIINTIKNNHPKGHLIYLYNQKPNLKYVPNLIFTFKKATGKYIAILDGDDYWTDKNKLKKQIDFLEKNPDYSACGADSLVIYEDIDMEPHLFSQHLGKTLSNNDLLKKKIFQTSTFVFKKKYFKDDFPTNILSADRCLYLLMGAFGKVKVMPFTASIYRKFEKSLSRKVTYEDMHTDINMIFFIKKYSQNLDKNKLKAYLYYTIISYSNSITKKQFKNSSQLFFMYNLLSTSPKTIKNFYRNIKESVLIIKQKKNDKTDLKQFLS